jgi:RNA binding exosome subunit
VVTRFAAASDASACKLLTTAALKNLYGNFRAKRVKAKANCARTATGFKGEQIKIIRSELLDDLTAKVVAHNAAETFSYSVNLRRKSGSRPWRIDSIAQAKLE